MIAVRVPANLDSGRSAGIRRLATPDGGGSPVTGSRRHFLGSVGDEARRPPQRPLRTHETALDLVQGGEDVVVTSAQVRLREPRNALAAALDGIGERGQLGGDGAGHARNRLRRGPRPVGSLDPVERVAARPDVAALVGYHSPQVDVSVRLNTNESPVGPPEAWLDELAAALRHVDWHRYPDRRATELRNAIAAFHGVDQAQVFAANGANEVLQTVLLAYGGSGRTVATFEPSYQLHSHIARITGAIVVSGERAADFTLDDHEITRVMSLAKPSVTFLCSPNNPTGLVEPPSRVAALLAAAPGLVVIDEAYGQFASWSALELVAEDRPLAVVRTFSKTWSLAAARLGYLIGPSWLVADLEKVVLPYHLDAAKQLAGTLALRFVDEMNERVAGVVAERSRLAELLAGLDVDVFPSEANFILFRPRDRRGHDVWQALIDRDVLVRDCSGWPRLADCLRVTIGTSAENDLLAAALASALATEQVPA